MVVVVVECGGGEEVNGGEDHSDHNDDYGRCILQDPGPVLETQKFSDLGTEPLPSWL